MRNWKLVSLFCLRPQYHRAQEVSRCPNLRVGRNQSRKKKLRASSPNSSAKGMVHTSPRLFQDGSANVETLTG